MSSYLSKEKKAEIFAEYAGDAANTGSVEGQVAMLTYRIQALSDHLKTNNKDQACRKALLTMVGKRKRFLAYISSRDINKYRALIEKLNIRK